MIDTIEELAKEAAGNWHKFESFGWSRAWDLDDADQWCIVYTSNRDSRLLDQSNAAAIEEMMAPYCEGDDPDCVSESHSHWAVGHVDGYSIRVYRADGSISPAFEKWCEIQENLENYPILDEEDYSQRESEATHENLETAGGYVARKFDYELPDDWADAVYSWLSDHGNALENRDDQGGYPSDDEIREAFDALGYPCALDD